MGACASAMVEQQQSRNMRRSRTGTAAAFPPHYGNPIPFTYGEGQTKLQLHLHVLEDTERAEGQPPGGALILTSPACRLCRRAVEHCETGQVCAAAAAAAVPAVVPQSVWDPVRDTVVQPRWQPPMIAAQPVPVH